jgi:hypothetical protein
MKVRKYIMDKQELKDTGLHCRGRGFNCHGCDRAKFCSEYVECKPLKHKNESEVKFYFSDDEYIHWFECEKCKCNRIVYKSIYCPKCGSNLKWNNINLNDDFYSLSYIKDLMEE